jgi:drug/metabolite transporter (DMT)-like permease
MRRSCPIGDLVAHIIEPALSPDRAPVAAKGTVWPSVIGTALLWGCGGLLSKALVADGVDPFVVTAGPFAAGAVTAWLVRRRLPNRAALLSGLMLGLINTAGPALLFNIGYETLPAGIVTLLIATGPIVTAITAHFVFDDERFNWAKAAGLVLSLGGVGVLSSGQTGTTGRTPIGVFVVLAGAVLGGSTGVWSRAAALRHGAKNLVPPQLTSAALMPLVAGTMLGRDLIPPGGFQSWHVAGLVSIGVMASFLGFRMIMRANEIGTTGQVSLIGYLLPVVGVGGGAFFFGESITTAVIGGGALILAGVVIAARASVKPARVVRSAG